MTMPASGPLNMGGTSSPVSVAQELGLSLTAQISMNDSNVRTLAGVGGSGTQWSMNSLYGKSNRVTLSYTFSSNTANASLNLASISGYIAGKSDITVTVNSGVYLYSTSTGNAGLAFSGGTSGDTLVLVNNGFILGQGGKGGSWQGTGGSAVGSVAGGPALSLSYGLTVNNTNGSAYIAGGGGGGGYGNCGGGGGAGGAAGGDINGTYSAAGGAGGGPGASGSNGNYSSSPAGCCPPQASGAGGGGGRILPGSGGAGGTNGNCNNGPNSTGKGGGAGGGGGSVPIGPNGGAAGGSGNSNAPGRPNGNAGAGGGGGWGASGSSGFRNGGSGGGNAVSLNGNSITWTSGDTSRVYGAVA